MRLLVDTNILIPLEPTSFEHVEPATPIAAELVRRAQGVHGILVHPASLRELGADRDPRRREVRSHLLGKYVELERPPEIDTEVESLLGSVRAESNDDVDHRLLAAVFRDAVAILVTEDEGIHRKARSLRIEDRVVHVRDAVELLRSLSGDVPTPPPFVTPTPAHALREEDPIFGSFRDDYPEFDDWLRRCKREGRQAWVIENARGSYAGVCIVKDGDDYPQLGGKVLKVSSLKVSEEHQGNRYGELLLKTIFQFCSENRYHAVWLSVFEHHEGLITLLTDFGFEAMTARTALGELVLAKSLRFSEEDRTGTDALQFHIRFGPPALKLTERDVFLIPIQPRYHKLLFPDAEPQLEFVPRAFGNALRKAYLSRASIRQLGPGSALLFYRSWDQQAVTCAGVVESVLVSRDPDAVASFAGQRTVYSSEEITRMCRSEVLALLFRQDRLLDAPIPIDELVAMGAAKRAPQSIMSVNPQAISWLTQRIGA